MSCSVSDSRPAPRPGRADAQDRPGGPPHVPRPGRGRARRPVGDGLPRLLLPVRPPLRGPRLRHGRGPRRARGAEIPDLLVPGGGLGGVRHVQPRRHPEQRHRPAGGPQRRALSRPDVRRGGLPHPAAWQHPLRLPRREGEGAVPGDGRAQLDAHRQLPLGRAADGPHGELQPPPDRRPRGRRAERDAGVRRGEGPAVPAAEPLLAPLALGRRAERGPVHRPQGVLPRPRPGACAHGLRRPARRLEADPVAGQGVGRRRGQPGRPAVPRHHPRLDHRRPERRGGEELQLGPRDLPEHDGRRPPARRGHALRAVQRPRAEVAVPDHAGRRADQLPERQRQQGPLEVRTEYQCAGDDEPSS